MKVSDRLAAPFRALAPRISDDWRQSWRFGSVRLHAIATALAVYMADNPTALRELVAQLPPVYGSRFPILIAAGSLWLAVGWLVRVWRGVNHA